MPFLIPYGLRKIWGHPANRGPVGLRALARCLSRSGAWASYQLQKQLGVFPAQGPVIPWVDGKRVRLLGSSQQSQAGLYYGLSDWPSIQFLRRYLRHGDLCADFGANVRTYSLLLARQAGAANVHALRAFRATSASCTPTCGSTAALALSVRWSMMWPWPIARGWCCSA